MSKIKSIGGKILAGIGILAMLGTLAGCSEIEKLSWERLKATHLRMITGRAYNANQTVKAKVYQKDQIIPETPQADASTGKAKVTLYFADKNGESLVAEQRTVAITPGIALNTVNELINGPTQKDLAATMPKGTTIKSIDIKNGLCRIDMSKEFRENHWGGSSGELLTVYSLVDTLTQFPTVKKVEILVNGQRVETLKGHMDLTTPVFRNTQIIKKQ